VEESDLRFNFFSAGVIAVAGVLSMCSAAQADDKHASLSFIMVTHSPVGDPYWTSVARGLEQAGKDLKVNVQYRGTDSNLSDPNQQRRNIEAAIASKPDGLIISDPSPDSLNETISKAAAAGVPVILVNQGSDQVKSVGAIAFVGDEPATQGKIGAEQFNGFGSKHTLVITAPMGAIPFVDARTNGFKSAFKGATSLAEIPIVNIGDSSRIKTIAATELQKDPSIDAVFSIGSCCIAAMLEARADLGPRGKAMHWGTIDVTIGALDALKSKELDFALDAQQFAQGYYPVVMLALYARQAIRPAMEALITGPAVITPENVERRLSVEP
jgi:simple sugar transport system substrate-binding protein